MSRKRVLVLGPSEGWHANQLRLAAQRQGMSIEWATYESLSTSFNDCGEQDVACTITAGEGFPSLPEAPLEETSLRDFDFVLARTMPVGSLEQITLRLSALHSLVMEGQKVVNPPAALEIAIDKYRTLARVARLGYQVPATRVVQSRREAMQAFDELGGDVVVKPLFGGEGRGVMRVADRELAWFTFATLERIDAVLYVQKFIRPGGVDTRLLVIGDEIFAVRRYAVRGWKTNVSLGGRCEAVAISDHQHRLARSVADDIGMKIGSVDLLDCESGIPKVLEVNAVPGWKGAECALGFSIAERMLNTLK